MSNGVTAGAQAVPDDTIPTSTSSTTSSTTSTSTSTSTSTTSTSTSTTSTTAKPATTTTSTTTTTTVKPTTTTAATTTVATTTNPAVVAGSTTSGCNPSYPTLCLPIGLAKNDVDCGSAVVGGRTNFPVLEPDPYGLDSSGVGDGVGCEAEVLGTSTSRVDPDGLAATGSNAPYLALMAVGLVLIGLAASRAVLLPTWHTTGTSGVRFTVESVRRKRP